MKIANERTTNESILADILELNKNTRIAKNPKMNPKL